MACPATRRLNGKDWPLHSQSDSSLCSYKIDTTSLDEMSKVIADAQSKPDYVKRSRLYKLPGNRYRTYVYFRAS